MRARSGTEFIPNSFSLHASPNDNKVCPFLATFQQRLPCPVNMSSERYGLSTMTMPAASGKTVKVVSWYDNEWGYSRRTADLIKKVAAL